MIWRCAQIAVYVMGPEAGFEPAPTRLRAECSTAELLRNRARIVEQRLKNVKDHDRHNAEGKKNSKELSILTGYSIH